MHINVHSYSSDDLLEKNDAENHDNHHLLVGLGTGLVFWLSLIGFTLWISLTTVWANEGQNSPNDPMVMKVYPDGTKVILRWSEVGKTFDNGIAHGGAPKIVAYDPTKDGVVPIGEQSRTNSPVASSSATMANKSSSVQMVPPSEAASPFMPNDNSWYISLQNGASFVSDINLPIGGSLIMNTGYRLDVPIGYRVNEWFSCEFAPGFLYNTINSVKLNQLEGLMAPVGGNIIQVPLMINALITIPTDCPLEPYFGGGVGAIYSNAKIELGNLSPLDSDLEGATAHQHCWSFGYSALAGLNYHIDSDISIGICYKFMGTTAQNWMGDDVSGNTHTLTQSVEATATLRF